MDGSFFSFFFSINVRSNLSKNLYEWLSNRERDILSKNQSQKKVDKAKLRQGNYFENANACSADHGRSDWLGYWDEFVQKACFIKLVFMS